MKSVRSNFRRAVSVVSVLLLLPVGALLMAQQQQPVPPPPPAPNAAPPQQLSPEQLSNLVAPIALYPDSLLSQLLVASTYPLEVVEAGQWLQQNRNLQGQALADAAKQQNWDPSVQALVVFPDVLNRLNSDIRWTTDLGNAFLAQQADVMAAVQRLRAQAQANGKLNSNSQQTVTSQTQGDQTAIQIVPADPQVVYVPVYNPEYIWGPPVWGYYPPLWYPAWGFGFGFGPGIYIGGFFGGLGWGGWGWGCNWWGGGIYTNAFFFNHYGFHGFGPGFRGGVWAHNPEHRLGVPYANRGVASRFGNASAASRFTGGQRFSGATAAGRGSFGATAGARGSVGGSAAQSGGWRRFGQPGASSGANTVAPNRNSFAGQSANRGAASNGGWNRFGGSAAPRSTPAPNAGSSYRSAPSFGGGSYRSAPSNGGGSYRSAPSFSGGRSAPSFSGGRSAPSFGGGGGGGGFRGSAGGGGGFHGGGGGGGSHGGGGGGSHGGGGRR